jgi:hypothetical protein
VAQGICFHMDITNKVKENGKRLYNVHFGRGLWLLGSPDASIRDEILDTEGRSERWGR